MLPARLQPPIRAPLDRALAGWQSHVDESGSLEWVLDRVHDGATSMGAWLAFRLGLSVDGYKQDSESAVFGAYERRAAGALRELGSSYLGAQADPDRATVVIVAQASAVVGDGGVITIDGGPPIGVHALWRQLCDARVKLVGPDGV